MNNLMAGNDPQGWRDDGQDQLEGAMPPALLAVSGLRPRVALDSTALTAADQSARGAAIETKGASTTPVSARGVQEGLPETDPNQPSRDKCCISDPSLVVPVIASAEEICRARELRQQLRNRYLNRPSQPCALWCVGID